jgi:hypothetical protein
MDSDEFNILKRQLGRKRLSSDDEERKATAAVLKGMSQNSLFHGFELFIKRKNVFNVKDAT